MYLVGAGPGDAGLLTLAGARALAEADVVLYDRLVSEEVLSLANPSAELIPCGKHPGGAGAGGSGISQEELGRLLLSHARAGRVVVRLKGGDPCLFGRGGEEALLLEEAGVPYEVIPGVTAASASICAGIPLTHRGLSSLAVLVTGHEGTAESAPSVPWRRLAGLGGTLAIYMGAARAAALARELLAGGMPGETPVAVLERLSTPEQSARRTTLAALAGGEVAAEAPALLVLGGVVALGERIRWFEGRPLRGVRCLLLRPRGRGRELAARLAGLGALVRQVPAVRLGPAGDREALLRALRGAGRREWVVWTSAAGVEFSWRALWEAGLDARLFAGTRIAAVGPATAEALERVGLRADLVAPGGTVASLAEALARCGARDLLCLRSSQAGEGMSWMLEAHGAEVEEVVAYACEEDEEAAGGIARALGQGVDCVVLTSAYIARVAARAGATGVPAVSIGPATSAAARECGFRIVAEADPHTAEGLLGAIVSAFGGGGG